MEPLPLEIIAAANERSRSRPLSGSSASSSLS